MAVKTPVGIDGSVTPISGHYLKASSYSLDMGVRLINTTGYSDGGYEVNTGGLYYGRWSIGGFPQYDDTATSPGLDALTRTAAAMVLQVAQGCVYSFSGIIEHGIVGSDVNGAETLMFTGPTSGAVAETWDDNPS